MSAPIIYIAIAIGVMLVAGIPIDARASFHMPTRAFGVSAIVLKSVVILGIAAIHFHYEVLPPVAPGVVVDGVVAVVFGVMGLFMLAIAGGCECLAANRLRKMIAGAGARSMHAKTRDRADGALVGAEESR